MPERMAGWGGRRRRGPRELSYALARLRSAKAPPTLLARVQERWLVAVGERVSQQAAPVAERDGVVTVSCRSAVWSAELAMLSQELLGQVNQALPEDCEISGLRFTTRPS